MMRSIENITFIVIFVLIDVDFICTFLLPVFGNPRQKDYVKGSLYICAHLSMKIFLVDPNVSEWGCNVGLAELELLQ